MANTKITALTALGAVPASGDQFVIVDVSDTTHSANGTTKKLAASFIAFLSQNNTFTGAIVATYLRSGSTGGIANNTAVTITPPLTYGLMLIGPSNASGLGNVAAVMTYAVNSSTTPNLLASGSLVETTSGVLTGTTGTNNKVTFSCATGLIYVENRLAYSINLAYLFV